MSANNGVVRIGRKGLKKFAFGEDGPVFEVDVVVAWQQWVILDNGLRDENDKVIAETMPLYHQAAISFVEGLSNSTAGTITVAEALDFIARLKEQYDNVADFFQVRSLEERVSPGILVSELLFSVEENSVPLMN